MLNIYCDGGARGNPGPAASAFIVKSSSGGTIYKKGIYLGIATNNQAEYQAVIQALLYVIKQQKTEDVDVYVDSILVASQINGLFKIKNPELRNLLFKIRELESQTKSKIKYIIIPRKKNLEADLLVNLTLDNNLL